MKKYTLQADMRTDVGRKVKHLRTQGQIPATIYGKAVKSQSLTVGADAFAKVFAQAGETGLVDLAFGSSSQPVLIHTVQKHAVTGAVLHVEFYQVNLKEKVKTHVPLELSGDAPAVLQKLGVLLTLMDEVEVEALPADLPEKIIVEVASLVAVDAEIKVGDIKAPQGVAILTAPELGIVRVGALISKEAEAQAVEEAQKAAEATVEASAPQEVAAPAASPDPGKEPS